jgi:16S rRNA (uracil1498-N3)-methyltransferase
MSARRIFVPPERIAGGRAELGPEGRHYLRDVLRLQPGEPVEAFDGAGGTFAGVVEDGFAALRLGPRSESPPPAADIALAFALAKGDRCDWVVQKATELGASRLLPIAAARSVVRLEPGRAEDRVRRWRRIAEEAARQCGRADVPEVAAPVPLGAALDAAPPGFARIVFHGDGGQPVSALEPAPARGYLAVVGPEGGLAPEELAACDAAGAIRASLGPRTLRAETAAIAVVVLLQARFGDLGPSRTPA